MTVRGWSGVVEGIHTVRRYPLLARLAVVQVLASLSAGATSGLLVVLAERRLGVGPSGFRLLFAAIRIGAAMGPLLLRRFVRPADRRWLFGRYGVRGGVDLTLAAVTNPVMAGAALGIYGVSTSTGMSRTRARSRPPARRKSEAAPSPSTTCSGTRRVSSRSPPAAFSPSSPASERFTSSAASCSLRLPP